MKQGWSALLGEFDRALCFPFSPHPLPSLACLSASSEALLADAPDSELESQSAEHGLFQKWCPPSFGLLLLALHPVAPSVLPQAL